MKASQAVSHQIWAVNVPRQKNQSGYVLLVEAEKGHHTHQVDLSEDLERVLESQALDPILGVAVIMFLVNWVLVTQLG